MASSYVTFSTVTPAVSGSHCIDSFARLAFTRRCVTSSPNARRRLLRISAKASTKNAMEYRKLGDSDLNISEVTMGTVRWISLSLEIVVHCSIYRWVGLFIYLSFDEISNFRWHLGSKILRKILMRCWVMQLKRASTVLTLLKLWVFILIVHLSLQLWVFESFFTISICVLIIEYALKTYLLCPG